MVSTSDTQICRQIEELLADDNRTKDSPIEVACLAGNVTLSGDVKRAAARMAAEEIARSVTGVHAVDNELRVR